MATHASVLAWRIPGTGGAWWAAVCGVTQSRTRLKQLSSSSSSSVIISRSVYVATNGIISFFLMVSNIPLYTWTTSSLSIPLSLDI